ncbi:MAG: BMP family ABC transporter substrate-binding protein [Candidatus Dormibacteraeota bacterium]|nr:BMP family ABC transporter substrate-binding protein [Candidatus Dormibacteraeota bacterium]
MTNADGLAAHSMNQIAAAGARSAAPSVQVLESHAASDYLGNLQRCAASRPNLTIAVSAEMSTAIWRTAQLHPSLRFALVDATPVDDNGQAAELPNVADLLFKEQEPGYLVGVMAGLIEKQKVGTATHNTLGILGMNHGPGVDPYIAGYVAGARSVDPDIQFKVTYSDSQDPAFCKQLGITQISGGADILFEVTGHCTTGYIDAAYDASAYSIGSDIDEAYLSPAVITSAVKRVDRAVALTVQQVAAGSFSAGTRVFSIRDDAIDFTTPSSVVPQDIINQVLAKKAAIRSGAITPPATVPPGI